MTTERILIVDDDEMVRTGLALDLEGEGYDVLTASSAEEALSALDREPVHLILSDLVMVEMDGMDLLHRVRRQLPDVAFVIITGHGTVGRALAAVRSGANDFIQKPADSDVIRQRVRTVLDDARLRRTLQSDRRKERERRDEVQKRWIREQRMVSLGRLADGVSEYLADVLEPMFRCHAELVQVLPSDHPALEHADEINYAARKADALIRDLHTIGHGAQLRVELLQLEDIVHEYLRSDEVEKLKRLAPRVKFLYSADAQLPRVNGSSTQIEAVIKNLVVHALEGMPDGGELSMSLRAEQVEPGNGEFGGGEGGLFVAVKIQDTAPDQPAQDLERVFEPFQPRKVGDRVSSTGLSLSVVYRVLQEHRGFVDIQYREGAGTTYTLYFPAAGHSQDTGPADSEDYSGHETVLVLDDSKAHREMAAELLQRLGYHVITAEDGPSAIERFREARKSGGRWKIDLAILDLVLGDAFDGLEAYKQILEICPGQKAILVSGFAEYSRIVEARKLGLSRYLQKPYCLQTLGQAVRAELDKE